MAAFAYSAKFIRHFSALPPSVDRDPATMSLLDAETPAMTTPFALQPADLDSGRARLAALEVELAQRELDLATLKVELQGLQSRYLEEVGALYARLTELEADVAEAEVRAGLRSPPEDADAPSERASSEPDAAGLAGCSNRGAPSDDLKRVFRDIAKAIHPDLTLDEPARCAGTP